MTHKASNKMQKQPAIIFIVGLGHSGSTLLDMLLACQDYTIGLGEIDVILNKKTRSWFTSWFRPCIIITLILTISAW